MLSLPDRLRLFPMIENLIKKLIGKSATEMSTEP